jgi:hypothetical protein
MELQDFGAGGSSEGVLFVQHMEKLSVENQIYLSTLT